VLTGFKTFVLRGNVVDLAVAVVIGSAFTTVVGALVEGLINPIIGAVFGQPSLVELWDITLREGTTPISIGLILTATLNFVLVAAAIYLIVVLPLNRLAERRKAGQEPTPTAPAPDIALLTEIRDLLAARTGL